MSYIIVGNKTNRRIFRNRVKNKSLVSSIVANIEYAIKDKISNIKWHPKQSPIALK